MADDDAETGGTRSPVSRRGLITGIAGGLFDGFDQPTGDALATHRGVGE